MSAYVSEEEMDFRIYKERALRKVEGISTERIRYRPRREKQPLL